MDEVLYLWRKVLCRLFCVVKTSVLPHLIVIDLHFVEQSNLVVALYLLALGEIIAVVEGLEQLAFGATQG